MLLTGLVVVHLQSGCSLVVWDQLHGSGCPNLSACNQPHTCGTSLVVLVQLVWCIQTSATIQTLTWLYQYGCTSLLALVNVWPHGSGCGSVHLSLVPQVWFCWSGFSSWVWVQLQSGSCDASKVLSSFGTHLQSNPNSKIHIKYLGPGPTDLSGSGSWSGSRSNCGPGLGLVAV